MSDYRSKVIAPLTSEESAVVFDKIFSDPDTAAATEAEWKCSYRGCRQPADFIVKYMTDGDVDKEYLVCSVHEPDERKGLI